jgi:glycosyltransferase involved in cell wall biosynthesis
MTFYEVSVIVPVYDAEKYLSRCIGGLLEQTCQYVEIVIVNDGSPGACAEIASEYIKNYKNIRYVEHEHNKGLLQARITGAMTASVMSYLKSRKN